MELNNFAPEEFILYSPSVKQSLNFLRGTKIAKNLRALMTSVDSLQRSNAIHQRAMSNC